MKETGSQKAYDKVFAHVRHQLVDNVGAEKLISLYKIYTEELHDEDPVSSAQKLSDRLVRDFHASLTTTKLSNKQGVIIYNKVLTTEEACRRANFDRNGLKEAAHYLRNVLLDTKRMIN